MQIHPTADHLVTAVHTAAKLCGEYADRDTVERIFRGQESARARHYALHAVIRLFPGADKAKVGEMLGGGLGFYARSRSDVFKVMVGGPRKYKRAAVWWDEDVFSAVILAVSNVGRPDAGR